MICQYCRAWIDDDSVFCESCGSRVLPEGNLEETQELGTIIQSQSDEGVRDVNQLLSMDEEQDEPDSKLDQTIVFYVPEKTESEEKPEIEEKPELVETPELSEEQEPARDNEIYEEIASEEACNLCEEETDLQVYREEEPLNVPLFCMACGQQLPEGAAFCDICGTPTGQVTPAEIRRRRAKQSVAVPLFKEYFPNPSKAIDDAASEDSFSAGAAVFGVKALLLAILAAVFAKSLVPLLGESWFAAGDTFGFAAKVFLLSLVLDSLLVILVFGGSVLFKTAGTIRAITGVCGVANILPSVLWIITLILAASAPQVVMVAILVSLAVTVIYMGKAINSVCRVQNSACMYMTGLIIVVYIVILYLVVTILI